MEPGYVHFLGMAINMNEFKSRGYRTGAQTGPQFDMTPDGRLLPPHQHRIPVAAKLGGIAMLVAMAAGAIGIAAIALWLAMIIVPVAIVAGAVAYGAFRFQLWRSGGSLPFTSRTPRRWG